MRTFNKLLDSLKSDLSQAFAETGKVEIIKIKYLGRNGLLNEEFNDLTIAEKKTAGQNFNAAKKEALQLIELAHANRVNSYSTKSTEDATLPGSEFPKGSLHIVTYAVEEITRIFEKIGFIRMSYPEIEWEFNAFEALNMPKGHPARDDFETFFIETLENKDLGKMLLTPHTSSGQIREMQRLKNPPMRMINIAKCYRPNWDASHVPMFHQFEGFVIDRGINITHLKGTINHFAKEFFGPDRETRLRPFHFQFTEPSFEVDITCGVCLGRGILNGVKCKLCKSGWLELGGSGMIHPNVLRAGNIDPEVYSGWAFGIGVERTFMMKQGLKLDDIRTLYSGDIRFLEQF